MGEEVGVQNIQVYSPIWLTATKSIHGHLTSSARDKLVLRGSLGKGVGDEATSVYMCHLCVLINRLSLGMFNCHEVTSR